MAQQNDIKSRFVMGRDKSKAEQLKLSCVQSSVMGDCNGEMKIVRELLCKRSQELCAFVNKTLEKSLLKGELHAGIVLMGGTSKLLGLAETLHETCRLPVRLAEFRVLAWLDNLPVEYAAAVGLVLRGGC